MMVYCCCVVDNHWFISAGLWYVLYVRYLLCVTHTICLDLYFLISRPGMGEN
jgi:hypothetical protein